jgi:hypothetical protein
VDLCLAVIILGVISITRMPVDMLSQFTTPGAADLRIQQRMATVLKMFRMLSQRCQVSPDPAPVS